MKNILAITAMLALPLSSFGEEQSAAQFLLEAFGSQCSGVNTGSIRNAMGHTDSLGSVVKRLRDSEQCSGAVDMTNSLNSFNKTITDYTFFQSGKMDKLTAEKKLSNYIMILTDPTLTQIEKDYYHLQVLTTQTELVNASSGLVPFGEFTGRHAQSANQLVSSVNSFLGSMQNNPQCFKSNTSNVSSLISESLMAASGFAAPGTSLALATGGAIISALTQFISNYSYNKVLRNLDDGKMPMAIRCVSEVLNNSYCDSAESRALIKDYKDDDTQDTIVKTKYEGLDLLMHDMENLGPWLNEVYAGSSITSEGDLTNREKPILQAEFLRKVRTYLGAFSSTRIREVFKDSSGEKLTTAIGQAIDGLVYIMGDPTVTPPAAGEGRGYRGDGPQVENPIFLRNGKLLLGFRLIDPGMPSVPKCSPNDECSSVSHWLRTKDAIPKFTGNLTLENWNAIVGNSLKLVDDVLTEVNRQRAQVVSVDPLQVMAKATRELNGTNARDSLRLIVENADRISLYLNQLGCQKKPETCAGNDPLAHPYLPQLTNIQKTKELTTEVLKLIEMAFTPAELDQDELPVVCQQKTGAINAIKKEKKVIDLEKKSSTLVSCITTILKLAERGTDVYFSKVSEMVSYELEARYAQPQDKGQLKEILYSTRGNLIDSLRSTYNGGNIALTQVEENLETAMTLEKKTLSAFASLFNDKIIDILNDKEKIGPLEKRSFCFSILPLLNERSTSIASAAYSYCEKEELSAKGIDTIAWKKYISVKLEKYQGTKGVIQTSTIVKIAPGTEEERMCVLRNFYRKSILLEQKRMKKVR
jgi:hypothetical protein